VTLGNGALGERKAALTATTDAAAAMVRWIDLADRARRAINGTLTTYAADHDLPSDFNDRFFPSAPPRRLRERRTPERRRIRVPRHSRPSIRLQLQLPAHVGFDFTTIGRVTIGAPDAFAAAVARCRLGGRALCAAAPRRALGLAPQAHGARLLPPDIHGAGAEDGAPRARRMTR